MPTVLATFLTVVVLAIVHAYSGSAHALRQNWRSGTLSASGGIVIAYVFLELLPSLTKRQGLVYKSGLVPALERHVYIAAFFGLTVAFCVEVASRRSRRRNLAETGVAVTSLAAFRLSIAVFAIYSLAVGYAVATPGDDSVKPLWLFALAMALHYSVNDHALAEHHGARYRSGRWLLVMALLIGWAIGVIPRFDVPPVALALVLSYIAGGTVLNILRHELPDTDRESDVIAFIVAGTVYGALLIWLSP